MGLALSLQLLPERGDKLTGTIVGTDVGRPGSGVGSVFNRTYNRPPSRVLGSVPRFTRILTAPSLIPRASAASVTGTRRWFGVGSTPQRYVLNSSPTRKILDHLDWG